LRAVINQHLGNCGEVDDVIQDVLLQLWNQPHSIIVAIDMEVAHEVMIRANTVWRNYCDSLKQFVNDIARLRHGAPRL